MSQHTLQKVFFFQLSCFVNITNTYCLLWGSSLYLEGFLMLEVKFYARMHFHVLFKEPQPQGDLIPVLDSGPKKNHLSKTHDKFPVIQLFLQGRPPKSLSQPLGLTQGPIIHFQIYFYRHDLLSSKLNTPKMVLTHSSPDFNVSHISTHFLSHLKPQSQKINDSSHSVI